MATAAEKTCTAHRPYDKSIDIPGTRWVHPAAKEVGEQEDGWPGGDIVTYECPNCGIRWKEELPQ